MSLAIWKQSGYIRNMSGNGSTTTIHWMRNETGSATGAEALSETYHFPCKMGIFSVNYGRYIGRIGEVPDWMIWAERR